MFREPEGGKVFETDNLEADLTNDDEVKMDIQKGCGARDNSGPLFVQCESYHFSSNTKTTFNQHGLKICFSNKNNLLCILKYLPTNVIKSPSTIWRWDQVQGCDFIIIMQ